MSSVKQRGSKGGGGGSSASEKGAQASHPDDVAKKPAPSGQAHSKGGKAGGSAGAAGAGKGASSFCSLGRLCNWLFSLAFLAAAAFTASCIHHLLGELSQVSLRQEGFDRQQGELMRTVEGALQKVQSLQSAFGGFELTFKNAQQKQEVTEKTLKQGETEINRIGEVLQKLQNEILKDLSDGIHVVKDARERDFTSLENTVEERLTELTRSINDNIAEFTDVQKRSQDEINEVKTKMASLGETEAFKHELRAVKAAVDEIQESVRAKEKAIESLQSTINLMESDVLSEVKELVNLKQEHDKFKEAADTEHLSLQALQEKVLKAEESIKHFPDELKQLSEDMLHVKASLNIQEGHMFPKDIMETLQKYNQEFESRFRFLENKLQALGSPSAQHTEGAESLDSKYDSKLTALEGAIDSLRGTVESNVRSLTDTVNSLSESQLSVFSDVDELRRSVSDLPSNSDALDNIQKQVRTLLDQKKPQMGMEGQPGELSDVTASIDELRSSLGQAESDVKMLRTAVDNLVAYSVKIENNENNVESVKGLLDDIRNDLDRLFVKVENIHEKV